MAFCKCTITKDKEDLRADPYCKVCGGDGFIKENPATVREQLIKLSREFPKVVQGYATQQMAVNDDVLKERQRQNTLYGLQRRPYGEWLAIIGEEWGEVCQAFGILMGLGTTKETDAQDAYEELLHLAATASAAAEQIREERGLK